MDLFKNSKVKDIIALFLLFLTTIFVYRFLFLLPDLSLVGDAQRYNGYQAYIVKYSLDHFGQFGLWDQFLSFGMSWISHPGGALFSPTAWLVTTLFKNFYFGSLMIFYVHTVTAAFSYYFLFRVLGIKRVISFFGGIVSICNQYIMLFVINGWFEEFFGMTLLPLTVGLLWLSFKKRQFIYSILAAIVMSMNFFMNSYYVFHYNVIVILWIMVIFSIYCLRRQELLIFLKIAILFWVIFIGISAAKILPLMEFRSISSRNVVPLSDVESAGKVMTPEFFKTYLSGFLIPREHINIFTQWANKIALVSIAGSFIYLLFKRSLAFIAFFSLFVIGIWGYFANKALIDLYSVFYYILPGFNSNMYPYRFIIIIYFSALICIVLFINLLVQQKNLLIKLTGYSLGIILISSLILYFGVLDYAHIYPTAINISKNLSFGNKIVKNVDLSYPPNIIYINKENLESTLTKLVHVYYPEGRVYSDSPHMGLDLIYSGEIPSVQNSYNPIVPTYQNDVIHRTKTSDPLPLIENIFKIRSILNTRFELLYKNPFEYEGCMNTEAIKDVCNFLSNRLNLLTENEKGYIFYDKKVLSKFELISHPILIISDNRFNDFSGFISKKILFHPDFDEKKMTLLSGGSIYLDDYSPQMLKQFDLVLVIEPKVRKTGDINSLINAYKKVGVKIVKLNSQWRNYNNLQERSGSLFTERPAWSYTNSDANYLSSLFKSLSDEKYIGEVKIIKFTPEDVVVKISLNKKAVLQYSDAFFPGWKADVNGKKADLYMADGLVKGVNLPQKGTYTVRFFYKPDSFRYGLAITVTVLIVIITWVTYVTWKKIKNKYE